MADDLITITFADEASLEDASERIDYEAKDRLDLTLEVKPDLLSPEMREEFRHMAATFSDETQED